MLPDLWFILWFSLQREAKWKCNSRERNVKTDRKKSFGPARFQIHRHRVVHTLKDSDVAAHIKTSPQTLQSTEKHRGSTKAGDSLSGNQFLYYLVLFSCASLSHTQTLHPQTHNWPPTVDEGECSGSGSSDSCGDERHRRRGFNRPEPLSHTHTHLQSQSSVAFTTKPKFPRASSHPPPQQPSAAVCLLRISVILCAFSYFLQHPHFIRQ